MSTTNCVWDGNSQTEQDNGDELDYNDLWEPWKNIIVSLKTATANISHLQKIARRKNKYIKSDHIAEALENRNYLQHTITIQIASNGSFVSIEFAKQELMEQFCLEPLSIQGFNITFYPEGTIKRRPPKPRYTTRDSGTNCHRTTRTICGHWGYSNVRKKETQQENILYRYQSVPNQ